MSDESEMQPEDYTPRCPTCGEPATYRDAMGVFWDSNAHHWKESFKQDDSTL